MFHRILDRLEEWLILTFMATATLVTFVSVAMRYMLGTGFPWATELTIYLFIWMAKFGAAYGVRTGIHIGVDVLVNYSGPRMKKFLIITAMWLGIIFTGVIAFFGARWVIFIYGTGQVAPDLEWPMWVIYLAIPFGSGLMCYRFIQALMLYHRSGTVQTHTVEKEFVGGKLELDK